MHKTTPRFIIFISLVTLILCRGFGQTIEPTPAAQQIKIVRNALNRIKPFKVDFVQQVYTSDQMDLQESGDIIFNNDKQLKWTYTDPDYKVFLLEGDNYKFYDEDSEQLFIGTVKEKSKQWIWQLLFSDSILPHAQWNSTDKCITLKDNAQSLDLQVVLDNNHLPVKVIQNDPSGARMIFHFKQYRANINVSPDTFQLEVPRDVEVVRQ